MAQLRRLADGHMVEVPSRMLIGRAEICTLVLEGEYASSEHARISWTGERWEIKDLGSRNGTFVDESRLAPGTSVWLPGGAQLGFGDLDARWELVDDAPPEAMAIRIDSGHTEIAQNELLCLPDSDAPEVSLFRDQTGDWVFEDVDGSTEPASDQQVVTVRGVPWRLELPTTISATPHVDMTLRLDQVVLDLAVSTDEERARIGLRRHGVLTELEVREHAYLLVLLARARLEDQALPDEERGWRSVDALRRMLKVEPNAINVFTHRARQQLADAGVEGAAGIVEVRRGVRRLGPHRFELGVLAD